MKRIIERTIKETVDIVLDQPKYVCYLDAMYYRFTPVKENIEVTSFNTISGFEISVHHNIRFEIHFDALDLKEGYKEISGDEFYIALNKELEKYNLNTSEIIQPQLGSF